MEDALARLGALGGALGASPTPQQLEQLRGATAAALAAAGPSPSGQHQKRLWEAAAALWVSAWGSPRSLMIRRRSRLNATPWTARLNYLSPFCPCLQNASLDQCIGSGNKDDDAAAPAGADDGAAKVGSSLAALAALRQAACDLCGPVAAAALLPPDQAHLVRFHLKARAGSGGGGEEECPRSVGAGTAAVAGCRTPTIITPPLLPSTHASLTGGPGLGVAGRAGGGRGGAGPGRRGGRRPGAAVL